MLELQYTLIRGFLQFVLGDEIVSVADLKERKYTMTVLNYAKLRNKAKQEGDRYVSSSIQQVVGLIYKAQFSTDTDGVLSLKLKELRAAVPIVPSPKHGICLNIDMAVGGSIDASNAIMEKFDEWFGNKSAYPVEGKLESQKSDLNKVGYMNNPRKWDASTKFGLKRIELLDRLIEEFTE